MELEARNGREADARKRERDRLFANSGWSGGMCGELVEVKVRKGTCWPRGGVDDPEAAFGTVMQRR